MPRRGRRKKEAKEVTSETKTTTTTSRTRRRRTYRRKEFDAESWLRKHVDELSQQVGLDTLGLTRNELIEILSKIVDNLAGSSTYINVETMARRFRRYFDRIAPMIAAGIIEVRSELTKEQLEFIVNNIGDYILLLAPKIYEEVKRHNSEDLIPILQQQWIKAWINRRGAPIPPKCPKCGFNSLMPDLTCMVCGSAITDKEVKSTQEFKEMFDEFIKKSSRSELEYVLKAGYVLLSAYGIKSPRDERSSLDIEIFLSPEDKAKIQKFLKEYHGE